MGIARNSWEDKMANPLKKILAILVIGIMATMASCTEAVRGAKSYAGSFKDHFAISDQARDMNPDVPGQAYETQIEGNRQFAFEIYDALTEDNENLIFSPASISIAFGMTYAGAEGDAKSEIAEVMRFIPDDSELHGSFNKLDLYLTSLGEDIPVTDEDPEPFRLQIANSLWGNINNEINPEFLDLLALNYGAGFGQLDFGGDPSGSADAINGWIAEQTEDRITDALDEGYLNDLTTLLIVNAIYFLASWIDQFDESATSDQPFYRLSGDEVTVPLMHNRERYDYFETDEFQAVGIPYGGWEASMVVILPAEGMFDEVESGLADNWDEITEGFDRREVDLFLPRFEFRTKLLLKDILNGMGMIAPFSGGLGEMLAGEVLGETYIAEVIHEAFISVDEEGTEAAAVTIVLVETLAAPPVNDEPVVFRADRPFIFAITDTETGSIIFLGRVLNPV